MRSRVALLAVTVLMVTGFGFAGLAGSMAAPTSSAAHASATPALNTPIAHVPTTTAAAPVVSSSNAASAMATAALAATKAAGLKPNVVFVPRPSATPAQIAAAKESGVVKPLYTGSPAPMGLGYFGLSAGPGGQVVGTILNTTSVVATVDTNATGIVANDLYQSSPDSYGIQLNAVATNITLFGTPGYSFWTQNVIEFYPQTHFMILITNVWNFSGGPLSSNVFYSHGPYGVQVGTSYYYSELYVPWPVYYPFNVTLFMNSTITSGRDAVYFTVQLGSTAYPSENFTAPYDWVVFNSLKTPTSPPLTIPSNYTANGFTYNALGLTDDFELILGGPGGGSQADLFAADATLGLGYLDGSTYVSVPSAFSYGGETGETVTGANIAWSDASGGPLGLSTYGTMTTGPSILTGLWNATAPEGSYPVTLAVTPANAFNILNPLNWSANFTVNESAIAPEIYTNTLYLTPGNYTLLTELSNYDPVTTLLDVTGPATVTINLGPQDLSAGIYTPLWAFSNSEVAALATGGSGTTASPYIIPNDQAFPLSSVFGLYNDWTFPVYPGVFFMNTNATTEFVSPPSFNTATSTFAFPGPYMPAYNDLQYWFWNVSNVAVLNAANISGWFGASAWYPVVFDSFNMIFYEGNGNLVANDTFNSQGDGLLIYAGVGPFIGFVEGLPTWSPANVGGGNNTVWGNIFSQVAPPVCPLYPRCEAIFSPVLGLGLQLAASSNLIYNNAFLTPTTAWLLPLNLYSGDPFFYSDLFNITVQPATNVNYAPGFPSYPLTGSIIGTTWQGGNYWWDYGLAFNPYNGANNPYGVLPYDENASTLLVYIYGPSYYYATYIYPGGDYAPLIPFTLYTVTVNEFGLPTPNAGWDLTVLSGTTPLDIFATTATSHLIYLPTGSYTYQPSSMNSSYASTPGSFTVGTSPLTLGLTYQLVTYSVMFELLGALSPSVAKAIAKHGWTVEFNGVVHKVTGSSITFSEPNGTYPYLVSGPSGVIVIQLTNGQSGPVVPLGANLTVNGAPVVMAGVLGSGRTLTLSFKEKGLPASEHWCIELSGWEQCPTGSVAKYANLTASTYNYGVVSPTKGQVITATMNGAQIGEPGVISLSSSATVTLTFSYYYKVTFTESGLASGGMWSVTIKGVTHTNSTGDPITFALTNGTYSYKASTTETGYKVPSGKVTVTGANASVLVTFLAKKKP